MDELSEKRRWNVLASDGIHHRAARRPCNRRSNSLQEPGREVNVDSSPSA